MIEEYSEDGTRSFQNILNALRREGQNKSTSVSSTLASHLVFNGEYKSPSVDTVKTVKRDSMKVLVLYVTEGHLTWRDKMGYVGNINGSMFKICQEQVSGK